MWTGGGVFLKKANWTPEPVILALFGFHIAVLPDFLIRDRMRSA
jgi:hypothetical protein